MARSALPHIFSVLGITRRTHPQGSGNFTYTNPGSKSLRTFVWDDAGIDERGYLVLVEEELTGLVPLHVEGHIARVKVMMARGESVGRVVWVVRESDFQKMIDLLRFYNVNLGPLPAMEIWSDSGVRLGSMP